MSSNSVRHIHKNPLFQYCNHVSAIAACNVLSVLNTLKHLYSVSPPPPYTPPPLSASCARLYEPLRKDFGSAEK